jgi:hypothetical protein
VAAQRCGEAAVASPRPWVTCEKWAGSKGVGHLMMTRTKESEGGGGSPIQPNTQLTLLRAAQDSTLTSSPSPKNIF